MDNETLRERQAREYSERMDTLCAKLGHADLERLVKPLLPRVRVALQLGDVHLNRVTIADWDKLAGCYPRGLAHARFHSIGEPDDWPGAELRATARELPWRNAPTCSLSDRVGALKHTAARLARGD